MSTPIKYLVAFSVALSAASLHAEDGVIAIQQTPTNSLPQFQDAVETAVGILEDATTSDSCLLYTSDAADE